MAVGRVGFVGTGAIADAMVTGLLADPPVVAEIVISPRNAEIAGRLAERFAAVRIAADNQGVVDGCDLLVLSIRPQVAEPVVRALRFRPDLHVLSVIAATDLQTLRTWTDADVALTQAIPLPFVARRRGVTAIYPPNAGVALLFSALGSVVECRTREEYDLLAAASALVATYFGLMARATAWLSAKGLPEDKARAYLGPLFAELSQTALRPGVASLLELNREYATEGGLNEQVFADFERNGGSAALTAALDRVLARIRGDSAP
jgi:pyrroline-5-carboxylate reductase